MNLICWNLRKNNLKTIADFAGRIALELYPVTQNSFVLFILENIADAEEIGALIGKEIAELTRRDVYFWAHSVGGDPAHLENIICLHSADITCANARQFVAWQGRFDDRREDIVDGYLTETLENYERNRESRPERPAAAAASWVMMKTGSSQSVKLTESRWLRSPLYVELRRGTELMRVLALHAPGPGDSAAPRTDKFAEVYFTAVIESVISTSPHVLIGDFNLRAQLSHSPFTDVGFTNPQKTSYGKSSSRWDRIYTSGISGEFGLVGPAEEPQYTDHKGVALKNITQFGHAAMPSAMAPTLGTKAGPAASDYKRAQPTPRDFGTPSASAATSSVTTTGSTSSSSSDMQTD